MSTAVAAARLIAAPTSSSSAPTVGTKRTIAASNAGIGEHGRQRGGEALGRRAAEQVDRVRAAPLGRHDLGERRAGRFARLRQLEPGGLAGVRGEDAEPAGIRDERHAAPVRHGLRGEQRRDVDQLVERPRPDDARLAEECVDGDVRAGECRRVRTGCAAAGARRPALQREDRLAAREPARDAGERAWVAERLEVEDDHLGLVVVFPPLEQVVRGDVRLVADRHERGDPEAGRLRPLEQREPERAALRGEADLAGREAARREGRVERDGRGGDAEAVRAEQARAVLADEREEPLLPLGSLAARLGEAGRDDDERAHAGRERLLGRLEHLLARHADDGQVDVLRDRRHGGVAVDACDRVAVAVDG